jgi:hypothetical protein
LSDSFLHCYFHHPTVFIANPRSEIIPLLRIFDRPETTLLPKLCRVFHAFMYFHLHAWG